MQDQAQAALIELAARIADQRTANARDGDNWLREFRKAYRHMAVSAGERFAHASLDIAEGTTEKALASK